ncbi:beta-1,4-glucuronyltransferase 1-like [Prorops nasuta]|uniref:beta-1,4-glucuronyltransferase 1-like n=1 Tax=Prorops nasuta TaxID=863751 RepID=UPI0034CD03F1
MRAYIRRLVLWSSLAISLLVAGRLLSSKGLQLPVLVIGNEEEVFGSSSRPPTQQQDVPIGAPAYAAGMYMAGQRPKNNTSCYWYYALPDVLSYHPSKVAWSPETRERSPYRVLPFIMRGRAAQEELPQVTLCTHATADQVYSVVELAKRWQGPISLTIFAPGLDAGLAVALLDRACRCEEAMAKVSVHLVFPAGRPPALGQVTLSQGDCAASDLQWREAETERRKRAMTYPINVARNVARMEAKTARVLVSDIELLPSDNLASGFIEMVRGKTPKLGVVFVLPVFEIEANETPPTNKKQLLAAIRAGLAVYFHRFLCPHCQRFPGLTRWLVRPDPERVKPLIITKREFPYNRWEPVFIGTREDPLYAEEMSWEGKQDKMAQMFEMCLLNYRLVVLDGAFLVHTPGIKRKSQKTNSRRQEFLHPQEKRNAKIYQRTIKRLLNQYPLNRRCAP